MDIDINIYFDFTLVITWSISMSYVIYLAIKNNQKNKLTV